MTAMRCPLNGCVAIVRPINYNVMVESVESAVLSVLAMLAHIRAHRSSRSTGRALADHLHL